MASPSALPEAAFPDLEPRRILYEDEDLIAIDKPAGALRQGVSVHPPLDRDASGAVIYARRPELHRALASLFQGGGARTEYLALVRRQHPASKKKGSRAAIFDISSVKTRDDRALVRIRIKAEGHPIRAQLAAIGAPIAGDARHGGPFAPRLMLHCHRLLLPLPGRAPLRIVSEAPPEMEAWLEQGEALDPYRGAALEASLSRARERRFGLAASARLPARATTAFRLVHEAGDGLPELAIDVYGRWLVVHEYGEGAAAALEELLDRLDPMGFSGVYLKRRPRQANVIVDARAEAYSPSAPLRGEAAPEEIAVLEEGLPYLVRLGEGLSTGIFLDQRDNRRRVRALAAGRRVLNLFAYTCAFGIAAGAGGAEEVLHVDASKRALEWGRRNVEHAGCGEGQRFWQEDAFAALRRLAARGERFGLICLDPPTYARTKKSRLRSGVGYRDLAEASLRVLAPGGALLCCSNDRRMAAAKMRRYLHEAARGAGVPVAQLKELPAPHDFPPPPGGEAHLKSFLLTAES